MEREKFTPEQEKRINNTAQRIVSEGPEALRRAQDMADFCVDLMDQYIAMPTEFEELRRIAEPLQEAIRRAESQMESDRKQLV